MVSSSIAVNSGALSETKTTGAPGSVLEETLAFKVASTMGKALAPDFAAGGDVSVVVGVEHRPRSRSLSDSGAGKDAGGADQARRLTSSTEADWGGRSHGGPGH